MADIPHLHDIDEALIAFHSFRMKKLNIYLEKWIVPGISVMNSICLRYPCFKLHCASLKYSHNFLHEDSPYVIEAHLQSVLFMLSCLNKYINDEVFLVEMIKEVEELLKLFNLTCAVCHECGKDYQEDESFMKNYLTSAMKLDHPKCLKNCFDLGIQKRFSEWIFKESVKLEAVECIKYLVGKEWNEDWTKDDPSFLSLKNKYYCL